MLNAYFNVQPVLVGAALADSLMKFGLMDSKKRTKVIAFIRDGCSTNTAALRNLQFLFPKSIDIKCISHASNNIGVVLYESCKYAVKFVSTFNNMLNTSNNARIKFRSLINKEVKRYTGDIRWYYIQDCASQIFKFWPQVILLINDEDDFTPALRTKLKALLEEHLSTIRLELGLFQDVALPLYKLCYKQEGDDFLIPTTYDHWYSVLNLLKDLLESRKLLDNVIEVATDLYPDDVLTRNEAVSNTRMKIHPCVHKMTETSSLPDKLLHTLNIFRACRLLDYKFIANTPLPSIIHHVPGEMIRGEIIYLFHLPFFPTGNDVYLQPFIDELKSYQENSITYIDERNNENDDSSDDDSSDSYLHFWSQNVITLPNFSDLAFKMVTCTPSSATVERLFSLLSCFNDNQTTALADYAKARTMIRYNHNFRSKT